MEIMWNSVQSAHYIKFFNFSKLACACYIIYFQFTGKSAETMT